MARKKIPTNVETDILTRSRRRCCLCYFVDGEQGVVDGQIAHLDQDNENAAFDNLAFLCLRHHNIYDSETSVSKGLQPSEVKHYRDRLYAKWDESGDGKQQPVVTALEPATHASTPATFHDYLDGLSEHEIYHLARSVLIDRSQTMHFGRGEPMAAVLLKKGFLESTSTAQTLQELARRMPVPYVIKADAWRHLNGNKQWLWDQAMKRNMHRQDRVEILQKGHAYAIGQD